MDSGLFYSYQGIHYKYFCDYYAQEAWNIYFPIRKVE